MFRHPYFTQMLNDVVRYQLKIFNKMNSKGQTAYHSQVLHLSKAYHNQFFQASFFVLKRALSESLEHES
jgi:hypothetical protein